MLQPGFTTLGHPPALAGVLELQLISYGSWGCQWSETTFQMNLLCPQLLLFLLLSRGHRCLPQGKGFGSECWSWGGTGPGLDLLGLSPAVFAGGFPDWAGLRVCQRYRCCTHLAGSALWRRSPLCCRHAGKVHITVTCIHIYSIKQHLQYTLLSFIWNK